jgi:pimeloyl-ACP methyl ester carboxylesterase
MKINVHGHEAYAYAGGKNFDVTLPTVVFIHGAQNDHSVWALQSRYFAHHGFSVLAIDLPGHGRSQGEALSSVENMAAWLLEFLKVAGVQHAQLIGHSMGSLIALEACHQNPSMVSKLMLLGTAYPMKVSDVLLDNALHREQVAIDMVNIFSHSANSHQPSSPGPGFYIHNMSARLMQRISKINPKQVFHTDFTACNNYANGEVASSKVQCPTLFMLAKSDMMTPVKAAAGLRQAITHHQLCMIENSGHSMMAEQAHAVLQGLFNFAKAPT